MTGPTLGPTFVVEAVAPSDRRTAAVKAVGRKEDDGFGLVYRWYYKRESAAVTALKRLQHVADVRSRMYREVV